MQASAVGCCSTLWIVCALGGAVSTHGASRSSSAFWRQADTAYTVVAYKLSEQQEQQFRLPFEVPDTQAVTDFFTNWDAASNLSAAKLDWRLTIDSGTTDNPPTGPEDIRVEARFAYGKRGLFISVDRNDDVLVGICEYCLALERVHMFFGRGTATALYADTNVFADLHCSQLAASTIQFLLPYAVADVPMPEALYIGAHDTDSGATSACFYPGHVFYEPSWLTMYSYGLAESDLGILVNVPVWQNRGSHTVHEVLLPWSFLGMDSAEDVRGTRLAVALSGQDQDGGDRTPSFLGWRNQADPFTRAVNPATGDTTSVDCWGDILFSEPQDSAVARAGVVRQPGRARGAQAVAGDARAEYFSVTGRRLADMSRLSGPRSVSGVVVVRPRVGQVLSRRLVAGR